MSSKSETGRHESTLPIREPLPTTTSTTRPIQHTLRTEATAFIGEFIGTFMFLSLAFAGTQIALNAIGAKELTSSRPPAPDVSKLLYIAFAFGVSLAINVAIFADVSGGKFNPAVTTALFITGKIGWRRAIQTIVSQLLAAMAASGFVAAILPGPLSINTKLEPTMSVARGFFLEAFVTSMLVLTILMLEGGPSKPMYIGMSLFVAQLCSVFYTGGSLNPARSFGPSVVTGFDDYHYIYWFGPLLGSAVASAAYWLINCVRLEENREENNRMEEHRVEENRV